MSEIRRGAFQVQAMKMPEPFGVCCVVYPATSLDEPAAIQYQVGQQPALLFEEMLAQMQRLQDENARLKALFRVQNLVVCRAHLGASLATIEEQAANIKKFVNLYQQAYQAAELAKLEAGAYQAMVKVLNGVEKYAHEGKN